MFVLKRDGRKEEVKFDKITSRLKKLCWGLDERYVDPLIISQKVVQGVYPGVTTYELDELAAQTAAYMSLQHPDYSKLAARISVSNLHKQTSKVFTDNIEALHKYIHPKTKQTASLIAQDVYEIIMANKERLNSAIIYDRDFEYEYFGFKTLERSYLLKLNGKIVERPQQMLMRVAVGIHKADIEAAIETYDMMSSRYFTHATPTLYNAGTPNPQLSSCFLMTMKEDSIEGIYDTLKNCALISKHAGGIGVSVHCIRAADSYIRGTNGNSNGIVPMLRVFNNTARYVDQGGGKRKGSIAIYLEPWHADIVDWLELRKNHGNELERARDLFYGLWIPDLFMERVQANEEWSLFCPNEAPGLQDCYGAKFKELYESYEARGLARKKVKAQVLWFSILDAQVETGTPYILFKDACNEKSNQKNLGCIKSSNLCTEIVEYTSPDEIAVCNLASINLSAMVDENTTTSSNSSHMNNNSNSSSNNYKNGEGDSINNPSSNSNNTNTDKNSAPGVGVNTCKGKGVSFDFAKLYRISKIVTKNLNKVIDVNFYPVKEAKNSNMRHRPIGIGVQGLADAFIKMRLPFESDEARQLNKDIFETIYFAACEASMEMAKVEGPYSSFEGSPMSQGIFQFDLWKVTPGSMSEPGSKCPKWDWDGLRQEIMTHGIRNSLLLAPMPTASTAQILGNNESVEPFTSNMYNRRVLAGEFAVVNKYLLKDLIERGVWNDQVRNQMMADKGSVMNIREIPSDLKELYKTVWEIKQKTIIDMAADRGAYICQSQSMNIHMAEPTVGKLTSMHFYSWKKGLKTGMYYLRTRPKADAIQFTVDQTSLKNKKANDKALEEDDGECLTCSA